jgi:hypothetical protein
MPDPTTPIERAAEALTPYESRATKRTDYGEFSTPILTLAAKDATRAALTAALTDPDDPDALARVLCYLGVQDAPAPVCDLHQREAAAVRTWLFGDG